MSQAEIDALNATIIGLVEEIEGLESDFSDATGDYVSKTSGDNIWLLIATFMVFFMHAGFTMLEAGSVRAKNSTNIMFKNIGTIALGSLCYWFVGYGLAYGADENANSFIGSGNFMNDGLGDTDKAFMVFQLVFAATAATIVSGTVAGRVALPAYFLIAIYITAFVYPVVSHWIWQTGGWISAFTDPAETQLGSPEDPVCGMIDFAGSAVVHMTGGVAGFWGALIIGPRLGRFADDGTPNTMLPHSYALVTLGTFILWFGWYGFNCGSTLLFDGNLAAKVAVTTTLAPSAAAITGMALSYYLEKKWDLGTVLNCVLAGLVSITAPCPVVEDYAALIIGALGAVFYIGADKLMLKLKIDDPVNAVAVHGVCGLWGVLSVGIFATKEIIAAAAYNEACIGNSSATQFGVQLVGALSVIAWVSVTTAPVFFLLKIAGVLRVPESVEEAGIDMSEHGSMTYEKFSAEGEPYKG
jgi:Amt family ammonium transporter